MGCLLFKSLVFIYQIIINSHADGAVASPPVAPSCNSNCKLGDSKVRTMRRRPACRVYTLMCRIDLMRSSWVEGARQKPDQQNSRIAHTSLWHWCDARRTLRTCHQAVDGGISVGISFAPSPPPPPPPFRWQTISATSPTLLRPAMVRAVFVRRRVRARACSNCQTIGARPCDCVCVRDCVRVRT